MKTIVLISCGKKKLNKKSKAKDFYIGNYFKAVMRYAKYIDPDEIYILSAKYGCLKLDDEIEPYDLTVKNFSESELKIWSKKTLQTLKKYISFNNDKIIILAGEKYRKYLIKYFKYYVVPFKKITMGKQMKLIKNKVKND